VVAATRTRLCEEVRVWGQRDPARVRRAMGYWERELARAQHFVVRPPSDARSPLHAPPWARYVGGEGALGGGGDAPARVSLDARGVPVRDLPPLSQWAAHRDAPVRLPTPPAGTPEAGAALHFSPGALARGLRSAALDPLLREEVAPLARELLRLGAWLDADAVLVLARTARTEAPLLAPLLAHLSAQAAATLEVLFPGPLGARRLASLLPHVPITGSGVTLEALVALLDAAAEHGDLPLALQLLEAAPPAALTSRAAFSLDAPALSHDTSRRLVTLAEEAGQGLLAARLTQTLGAGSGVRVGALGSWGAPLPPPAALPQWAPPPPPRASLGGQALKSPRAPELESADKIVWPEDWNV